MITSMLRGPSKLGPYVLVAAVALSPALAKDATLKLRFDERKAPLPPPIDAGVLVAKTFALPGFTDARPAEERATIGRRAGVTLRTDDSVPLFATLAGRVALQRWGLTLVGQNADCTVAIAITRFTLDESEAGYSAVVELKTTVQTAARVTLWEGTARGEVQVSGKPGKNVLEMQVLVAAVQDALARTVADAGLQNSVAAGKPRS